MPILDLQELMTRYINSQLGNGRYPRNQYNCCLFLLGWCSLLDNKYSQRRPCYDFNFDKIKVEVKDVKWNGSGNIGLAAASGKKILVTRPLGQSNPLIPCQIQVVKKCEQVERVTITDTIVRGLNEENGKINLLLFHKDIPEELSVEIDLEDGIFERTDSVKKSILSDEAPIGPNGAEAFVHSPVKEFIGEITCTVLMKGKVIVNGGGEIDLATAIQTLQELAKNRNDKDLHELKVLGKNVHEEKTHNKKGRRRKISFVMHGDVEFRWPLQPYIEWQKQFSMNAHSPMILY